MRILFCAAALALTGCAAGNFADRKMAELSDAERAELTTPLVCQGAEQCTAWWRRSQFWISTRAGMKMQTVSDAVIETYGVPNFSRTWAMQARREPLSNGQERIWFAANCGQFPSCSENPYRMTIDFKRYVAGGAKTPSP